MTDLQQTLAQRPLGLAFDIDGTLSPIAPTPDAAKLYPGTAELLAQAAQRTHVHVAILTGRRVEDGAAMIQVEGLTYVGSHGIEWSEGLPTTHSVEVAPETAPFVEPATRLLDLATRELSHIPGLLIERKRVGGVIHYRLTADHEQTRQLIFATLGEAAQKSHLTLSEGKKVVEIKAGVAIHKGTALRRFAHARHLKGLVFAGDDRTDLDAILELEQLRQDGISATAIAVQHDDTLPALLAHADLVVQEVPGMAHLLAQIVQQLPQYT